MKHQGFAAFRSPVKTVSSPAIRGERNIFHVPLQSSAASRCQRVARRIAVVHLANSAGDSPSRREVRTVLRRYTTAPRDLAGIQITLPGGPLQHGSIFQAARAILALIQSRGGAEVSLAPKIAHQVDDGRVQRTTA